MFNVACWTLLAWALLRGAVAAWEGAWSSDIYLAIAVVLCLVLLGLPDVADPPKAGGAARSGPPGFLT
jgi:hypothetical protein